jgi:Protein of unknown function with PCYCGC motif
MSRASRRREQRGGGRKRVGADQAKRPWWILAVSIGAAFLVLGVISQQGSALDHHPAPRAPELAADVVDASRYADYPRVKQVYEMAATVPSVLDGVYCHCNCSKHSGHYSLLDCFTSDHGASCDVCMSEAMTAYTMTADGAGLDDIRAEVDRMYAS